MVLDQTKSQLLEAAGEEFAEKGFEGATVRVDLRPGGDEPGGGELPLRRQGAALRAGGPACPPVRAGDAAGAVAGTSPAEDASAVHPRRSSSNVVALQSPTWHQTLMLREMVNPTRASEALVREAIRPRFERLSGILRRLCPGADERRIQALAFSVVGQCLHYKLTRSISERLVGAEAFARLDLDYLTDHITRFTLAALGEAPPFDAAAERPAVPVAKGGGSDELDRACRC